MVTELTHPRKLKPKPQFSGRNTATQVITQRPKCSGFLASSISQKEGVKVRPC